MPSTPPIDEASSEELHVVFTELHFLIFLNIRPCGE